MVGWTLLSGCAAETECVREVAVGELSVCVDVALSADERRRGLRGREPLEHGEGLLLRFPVEGEVCLVNDGVTAPVDAVFFDDRGVVTALMTLPENDATARCAMPARDVLELKGGAADGLVVGMVGILP
ncbi:MAG: DUF192 domain-containing protein [Myxococcales bacterium]|nr:DUF192 domain-containing protein [Myxococcales bacterium]